MEFDRRSIVSAGLFATCGAVSAKATPAHNSRIDSVPALISEMAHPGDIFSLWPDGAPGRLNPSLSEIVKERSSDKMRSDRAILSISDPRVEVFRPAHPNGAGVLIIPGGGYKWVAIDKEGYEMARWACVRGFTAFVLLYRLPAEGWRSGPDTSLADAQRAMRLIASRAGYFGIDTRRIAVMGFSAGGHVCADLAVRFNTKVYDPVDDADVLTARPFCAAPIYPVISMDPIIAHVGSRERLLGASPSPALQRTHSPDCNVQADTPPHFLVHAEDDNAVPADNSLRMRAALRGKGISVETHLFPDGGHGFGISRAVGKSAEAWPELWRRWAMNMGLA